MPRLLALDWDGNEARYVVAAAHGARLTLEAAGAVAIPPGAEKNDSEVWPGEALRSAVADKAGRATAIVGVERSQIELVSLLLPPASDAELPVLVRNQAMRENSSIAEDAALDFVAMDQDEAGPRKVTAVALSRSRLERIQTIVSETGLTPTSIVLRPYATAGLVLNGLENRNQGCLVVNVLAEEVDLIVLSGGKVVFWRTIRQTNVSHDEAAARRLMSEVKRTLLVAQSHMPGKTIDAVYLCGGLEEHSALATALRAALPLELTLIDPFAAQGGLADAPQNPGRFASLVGMLAMEAGGQPHVVDFLHPRKQPTPPDRRRMFVLAGAAATLIVLLGGYRVWTTFSQADDTIETLSADLDRLEDLVKRGGKRQKAIQSISDWSRNDVNWLDELRDLSLRFPSGRDAVVLRMNMSHGRESGGSIDMTGVVRDPVIVSHIENGLRDEYHQISSRHMQERLQEDNYSWHFESSIVVTPREPGQYVSHLPEAQRAAEPKKPDADPLPENARQRAAPSVR